MKTITLSVSCVDDECGMYSVYEFFEDGSFLAILKGCWHTKNMPSRKRLVSLFAASNEEKKTNTLDNLK